MKRDNFRENLDLTIITVGFGVLWFYFILALFKIV